MSSKSAQDIEQNPASKNVTERQTLSWRDPLRVRWNVLLRTGGDTLDTGLAWSNWRGALVKQ